MVAVSERTLLLSALCVVVGAVLQDASGNGNQSETGKALPHYIQLPGFNSTEHNLHSGPILLLNTNTFYVTNFFYDGRGRGAHFCFDRGSRPGTCDYFARVLDDGDATESLGAFGGDNVYVRLERGNVSGVGFLAVWSSEEGRSLGHVVVPRVVGGDGLDEPGFEKFTKDGRAIIRVPKCCNESSILTEAGCQSSPKSSFFQPDISYYQMNSTHLNNDSISSAKAAYVPYVFPLECKAEKIALYPEEVVLLQNGSLIYLDTRHLLSQREFCLDVIDDEEGVQTLPLVCAPPDKKRIPHAVFYIYSVGMLLSALFFFLTAVVFFLVRKAKVRGKCVIAYCLSMTASFACMALAQLLHVEGYTCNVFGYFLEFFLVLSFSWLSVLSFETYYLIRIRHRECTEVEEHKPFRNRLWIYFLITSCLAIFILGISEVSSSVPFLPQMVFKPQFGRTNCVFDEGSKMVFFLYIPICIGLVVSMVFLGLARRLIMQLNRSRVWRSKPYDIKHNISNVFRACIIVVAIALICWVMEMISFKVDANNGVIIAMDIIDSLQGVFVFILFVLHNPIKDKLYRRLGCHTKENKEEISLHNMIERLKSNGQSPVKEENM